MDAYTALRERAFQKRDKVINDAREVCRRDLAAIEAIARSLYEGAPPPETDGESMLSKLRRHIPRDRPWTIPAVFLSMEGEEPGAGFNEASIRTYVSRLAMKGEVRKLYKSKDGNMLWAAADAVLSEHDDWAAMSTADAVERILREFGPLSTAEMVVRLQERGYRADSERRTLMRSLQAAIKRSPGRFQELAGGRWGITAS